MEVLSSGALVYQQGQGLPKDVRQFINPPEVSKIKTHCFTNLYPRNCFLKYFLNA